MLSKTETIVCQCRHCHSERLRKNGRSRQGAQRAQCLDCGKTLVLERRPERYSPQERERIVRAATCERLSTRAIQRTFGPCYATLQRWVGGKNQGAAGLAGDAPARAKG